MMALITLLQKTSIGIGIEHVSSYSKFRTIIQV